MRGSFFTVSEHARKLFEGKDIIVRRFELGPGEHIVFEDGVPRAILSLDDYLVRYKQGDEVREISWVPGDIHWHSADSYTVENIGDTVAKFIIVTFKNPDDFTRFLNDAESEND